MQFKDLTGQAFGKLTVLSEELPRLPNGSRWRCKCECGGEKIAWTRKLRSGKALSCGCLTKAWVASFGGAFVDRAMDKVRKHGHAVGYSQSSEYATWISMRQRCTNPNSSAWGRYGGKGVRVHESWNDFSVFLTYMGPKPTPQHTIDRLNPHLGYEPGNVRWATKKQQGEENKTILIPVTVDGVSYHSVRAACRALGIHSASVFKRIWRGVNPNDAFDGLKRKT